MTGSRENNGWTIKRNETGWTVYHPKFGSVEVKTRALAHEYIRAHKRAETVRQEVGEEAQAVIARMRPGATVV